MKIECNKCQHGWDYKGKSTYYATCPYCMKKNKISEQSKNCGGK